MATAHKILFMGFLLATNIENTVGIRLPDVSGNNGQSMSDSQMVYYSSHGFSNKPLDKWTVFNHLKPSLKLFMLLKKTKLIKKKTKILNI